MAGRQRTELSALLAPFLGFPLKSTGFSPHHLVTAQLQMRDHAHQNPPIAPPLPFASFAAFCSILLSSSLLNGSRTNVNPHSDKNISDFFSKIAKNSRRFSREIAMGT
jgi:hypothetical protein